MRRRQNIQVYNPKQVRKLRQAEAQGTIGKGQQAKLDKTREARENRPSRVQVQQDMVQKEPEAAPAMPKPGMPSNFESMPQSFPGAQQDPGFGMSQQQFDQMGQGLQAQKNPFRPFDFSGMDMRGGFGGTLPQMMSRPEDTTMGMFGQPYQAQAMPQQALNTAYNRPFMPQNVSAFGQGMMQQGQQLPQQIQRPLMSGGGQSSGY